MLNQFNPVSSTWLHIDLNSCFATIEQQANPLLRGKPIAVAAYSTPRGCIIAPSIEAKKLGVKVGMRVQDGKQLYPNLIVLTPDPAKYQFVNRALLQLLQQYTPDISVRSIDEMLLNFNQLLPHKNWITVTGDARRGTPKKGSPCGFFWGKTRGRTRIYQKCRPHTQANNGDSYRHSPALAYTYVYLFWRECIDLEIGYCLKCT